MRSSPRRHVVREELRPPPRRDPGRRVVTGTARRWRAAHAVPHAARPRARPRSWAPARRGCGAASTASTSTASRSATRRSGRSTIPAASARAARHGLVRLVLERAATADDALDVAHRLLERLRAGRLGRAATTTSRTSRRSCSPTRAAAGSSRRATARGSARPVGAGAVDLEPRQRRATDWTRASTDVARRAPTSTRCRQATPPTAHRRPSASRRTRAALAAPERRRPGRHRARAARATAAPSADDPLATDQPDGTGVTVCMHRRDFHAQTTASMIVELAIDGTAARAWACLGNPCVGVLRPGVPARGRPRAGRPAAVAAVRRTARPRRGRPRRPRRDPRRARTSRGRAVGRGRCRVRVRDPETIATFARPRTGRSTTHSAPSVSERHAALDLSPHRRADRYRPERPVEFNLADLFERVADTVPDHPALVCGERRLHVRASSTNGRPASRTCSRRGASAPGDHVALYLYNSVEYLEACSRRSSSARCRST